MFRNLLLYLLPTLISVCVYQSLPAATLTLEKLQRGEPVTIVALGDSITGIYYHTGSKRAYPEILQHILSRAFPTTQVKVINAGISGHTTEQGLRRLQRDVLDLKPDLVTIMFGMNDVRRKEANLQTSPDQFRSNLAHLVQRCQEAGSEVILCTPNTITADHPQWSRDELSDYAAIIRETAAQQGVTLADIHRDFTSIYAAAPSSAWALMSETIHPNMLGHQRIAEVIAAAITGDNLDLTELPSHSLALPYTLQAIQQNKAITIVAMPPYDDIATTVLKRCAPRSSVNIISWPTDGLSLQEIERWGRSIRKLQPDLVIVAVPLHASWTDRQQLIQTFNFITGRAVSFGPAEWDTIAIAPSVQTPNLSSEHALLASWWLEQYQSKDLPIVSRPPNSTASAAEVFYQWWIKQQEVFDSPHGL